MAMRIYPAIDLRGGRVVRLEQGDYAREKVYSEDPILLASELASRGARYLHVVDLDGAKEGRPAQTRLIAEIVRVSGLKVQAGGGLRSAESVKALVDAGVERVVLGSLAARDPDKVLAMIGKFGAETFTLALDLRVASDGSLRLAGGGWLEQEACDPLVFVKRYRDAGVHRFLCTDIERDGMLTGPSFSLYERISRSSPGIRLQASGGIASLSDLRALGSGGYEGAIVGRALYEGKIRLEEALSC